MDNILSFKAEGIEIKGTRERLKELAQYINFEEEEPSGALADLISEIETVLNMKT